MFDWYEYIWYMDSKQEKKLGHWIGLAEDIGSPMTFWILPKSGIPIPHSLVAPLLPEVHDSDTTKQLLEALDDGIKNRLGDHLRDDQLLPDLGDLPDIDDFPNDEEEDVEPTEPEATKPDADKMDDPKVFDKYIGAQINLIQAGQVIPGKVISRKRDHEGKPIGHAANNPLLDTQEYNIKFIDGSTEAYTANVTAEAR